MIKKIKPWTILPLLLLFTLACTLTQCDRLAPILTRTPEETRVDEDCAPRDCPTPQVQVISVAERDPQEPVLIRGSFSYTNDFFTERYAAEHAVMLMDMSGFVLRDRQFEIDLETQVLGYCDLDADNNRADFYLKLPSLPQAPFHDVDNDGTEDAGVQIFAIQYAPNWVDGPFYTDDDRYEGWPTYLASVTTDSDNFHEVMGGKLIIWAPDGEQSFSSDFGADGLLFTDDDPVMRVPAGYSVIDLDQAPFVIIREAEPFVELLEPDDAAITDLSELSYIEAFETLFQTVRKEYAFSGIAGKEPDWDAVYAQLQPRIAAAQQDRSPYDFFLAMRDFALSFRDGHVSIDGGELESRWVQENLVGGYGFAIRELDDGRSIVVFVGQDSPAQLAGMQRGAEILRFGGLPIAQAISQTLPYSPQSTDFGLRHEQTAFLSRVPVNTPNEVQFRNPGSTEVITVTMTSVFEFDSLFATYMGGELDQFVLPIEYEVFSDTNIGYVRINSNSNDLSLAYRIFKTALDDFTEAGISGLIIDMRRNFGGSPYNLAGYFSTVDIPMGQLQYFNENSGRFEAKSDEDTSYSPMSVNYQFPKIILLVEQFCFSACELDAYALSQVPGVIVMGHTPTAGVEAETARGQFTLPEGISFGVPTGRFVMPDGSIKLEGVGVIPQIRIPVTAESVLSGEDVVLQRAIDEIAP